MPVFSPKLLQEWHTSDEDKRYDKIHDRNGPILRGWNIVSLGGDEFAGGNPSWSETEEYPIGRQLAHRPKGFRLRYDPERAAGDVAAAEE